MKHPIHPALALVVTCLGLATHNTLAAGAGLDVLIANTGGDRLLAFFDPESGLLAVAGTDQDDAIGVRCARDGTILVNDGEVRIQGGTPTLKNTRLILMHGGCGDDILVAENMSCVAMNGAEGADVLIWTLQDGSVRGISSGGGESTFGDLGNDWLVGGTGQDGIYDGSGKLLLPIDESRSGDAVQVGSDLLVWNNGDGSDL